MKKLLTPALLILSALSPIIYYLLYENFTNHSEGAAVAFIFSALITIMICIATVKIIQDEI